MYQDLLKNRILYKTLLVYIVVVVVLGGRLHEDVENKHDCIIIKKSIC